MNPEMKQKWIDALRSGEYKQGTGALRRSNDTYCCLGVLCDIAKVTWRADDDYSCLVAEYEGESNSGSLPNTLMTKYGIDYSLVADLITLNDFKNASFDQIANSIEERA